MKPVTIGPEKSSAPMTAKPVTPPRGKPSAPAATAATAPEASPAPRHEPEAMAAAGQWSLEAVGEGALAVNRKLLDMTVENVTSSLDLAKNLAAARTPMAMIEVQMRYWQERMGALARQAEELRALSAALVNRPKRD
jgi:hypothetical protein